MRGIEINIDAYQQKLEAIVENIIAHDLDVAIGQCDQLRNDFPNRAESYYLLGVISMAFGDHGKALRFMEEGAKLDPDVLEFAKALAALNAMTGNLSDMNYYLKLTLLLEPNDFLSRVEPEVFANPETSLERVNLPTQLLNGWVRFHQRRYSEALEYCTEYIAIRPDDGEAYQLMGKIHWELKEFVKGLNALRKADQLLPQSLDCALDLCEAYLSIGEFENARKTLLEKRKEHFNSIKWKQALVRVGSRGGGLQDPQLKSDCLALQALLCEIDVSIPEEHIHPVAKHEKLFVGVLINEQAMLDSIDFIDAWFQSYNKDQIRLIGYQQFDRPHIGAPRLKNLIDDWRETYDLDDVTLKHILTNDGIDVIIDLCGVNPGNRQKLLADRINCCRIGWLQGCDVPLPEVLDFMFIDEAVGSVSTNLENKVTPISLGISQLAYGGGSVFLEFSEESEVISTRPNPVIGAIFDAAAVIYSINMWKEVLESVPSSKLILGCVGNLEPELKDYFASRFAQIGLEKRISFFVGEDGRRGWGKLLSQVDILLDSSLGGGTISTCDALWMGVPVVTLAVNGQQSGYGPSILTAAGCGEWVALDQRSFIDIANNLLSDRPALMRVRSEMSRRIQNSQLCDLKEFSRRMEGGLREARGRFQQT